MTAPAPKKIETIPADVIELVAKTIHDHWQGAPGLSARPWDGEKGTCAKLPAQAEDFRRKARAVMEALSTRPAEPAAPVAEAGDGEVSRYIAKCREMSKGENGHTYTWWSRLADLLSTLEAERARADDAEQRAADALARAEKAAEEIAAALNQSDEKDRRIAQLDAAAQSLLASASSTYRKRNGQIGSFEGDDGEISYIVPFDAVETLRMAAASNSSPAAKGGGGAEAILWQEKRGVWKRPGAIVKHVRMSSGHMAWRATFDDGRHHHSDSADDAKAYADGFLAREQAEAFSTPTEGPASQTEGMGGEAKAKAKQALYSLRFEGQPMSSMFSAEELGLIVDTVRAALTPPETAEAVPPLYLIRKGGAFYRPNSQGYTRSIAEAGRYSLAEAEAITHPNGPNGPRDGMDYIPAPALASDPAPATDDRERLVEAFIAGATAVHEEIKRDHPEAVPRGDPEFYEAAQDYARAALATEASR